MPSLLRSTLYRFLPFLKWIGELRKPDILRADIAAGITVAMVLIPQSMANAQIAGVPAYYGLYAAFLPPMIAALFGSSRHLSTGSGALISLLTAAALQSVAPIGSPEYVAYAITTAMLVGIFQIALGVLRMGTLVNFLALPVVIGFTNAVAIIIGTTQIAQVFGVIVPPEEHHFIRVWHMFEAAANHTHWPTVGMAALAFVIMILLRRLNPRIPGVLIAVVVTSAISWWVGFDKLGGRVVGKVPEGLPAFHVPRLDLSVIIRLLPSVATISLIGFVGTISIVKAIATQTRQRIDANQELIGQGMCNLVGSLFQSYPASGSFARSAVNFRAGAQTGFASVVASSFVVVVLLWFTYLLYFLPLATLAAIIMVSVFGLIQIDPILRAWKTHRHDGIVAVATFVITLIFAPQMDWGVLFGVSISLILYLSRTMKPRMAVLSRHPDGAFRDAHVHHLDTCETMALLRFDGSLYFGSAGTFEDMMLERVAKNPRLRYVIVDAEGINQIDATGEEMLMGVVRRLRETRIEVLFARTKKQVLDVLERTGTLDQIGRERFFPVPEQALNAVWQKVEGDGLCSRSCPGECPLYRARPAGAMFYRV